MTQAVQDGKFLAGRVALVTGASRGLGAALAKACAQAGAHVVLLARTVKTLEAVDDAIRAAGGSATLMPFNLLKTEDIHSIGPVIAQRFGRLDILAGNAAWLGGLGPVAHADMKLWEQVFKLNVLANAALIKTLDPLLRGSDAGRAVFVTSAAAGMAVPFWAAYAASKAALDNMVLTYAAEVAYSPLKVNLVDPGVMATGMRAEAFPGEDPQTLPAPEDIAARLVAYLAPDYTRTGQRISLA